MTLTKRLQLGVSALACSAAMWTGAAQAAAPTALTSTDAEHYAAAFEACDRGDFIDAQMQAVDIQDKSLLGYLSFRQLMHPTAHKASFDELAGWMSKFRDLPLADRIFALAAKRKPDAAASLPAPAFSDDESLARIARSSVSDKGRRAREAYYSGDVKRALSLASASGERWIAGLSAYRLKDYAQAQTWFGQVAQDATQDAWIRAGAAFWGARAATAQGDGATATAQLQLAAKQADTFYGMIARRQLQMLGAADASDAIGKLIRTNYAPGVNVPAFVAGDTRAHRAAALAQLGRLPEAAEEVRAGETLAHSATERDQWKALGAELAAATPTAGRYISPDDYPLPDLSPRAGFTIDKALVYAIVRQESRFNPMAVSGAGAVGLMQLTPDAAARAAGDDKLKADMSPLFDPAFNLRVGQDYVSWLMERGIGYDLLQTIAAYNGGPGPVQRTTALLGDQFDPLLLIESLPAQETRNYVEKVVAGYWTYRNIFGGETKTLDAVASGAKIIDARLDLDQAPGAGTQFSAQSLQVGMR
jgi:soluble lytic murein transglycosylase-like protein